MRYRSRRGGRCEVRELHLAGSRSGICEQAMTAALGLALRSLLNEV